jgi:hypothetical protein
MHRALYLITAILCGLCLGIPYSQAKPIGCNWHNSTILKCWNNGTIENTTYYNKYGQYANSLDRWNWANYMLGGYYVNYLGDKVYYYIDFNLAKLKYVTDNSSYYTAYYEYSRKISSIRIYMNYTFHQNLNDDYVNITFKFDSKPRITIPFYLSNKIINIDINNNGDDNIINYVVDGEILSRNLSIDWNYTDIINNHMSVGELTSSKGINWILYDNYSLDTNINEIELSKPATLPIHNSQDWIDIDICSLSTVRGCTFQGMTLYPSSTYFENETIQNKYIGRFRTKYTCTSLFGCGLIPNGGDCAPSMSWGAGCFVSVYERLKYNNYTEIFHYYKNEKNWTCHNYTYTRCKNTIVSGYSKYFELESQRTGNNTIKACYMFSSDQTDCNSNLNLSNVAQIVSKDYNISNVYDPCIPPISRQWNISQNMTCDGYTISIYSDTEVLPGVTVNYIDSYMNQDSSSWQWRSYGKRNFNNITQK